MRLKWVLMGVVAWLSVLPSLLLAYPERVEELYRSRFGSYPFTYPRLVDDNGLTVNPTDDSVWMIEGAMVTHTAADGTLLGRSPALAQPTSLSVDIGNGTCWVIQKGANSLIHLAPDGQQLSVTRYLGRVYFAYPSPSDGSVWVSGSWYPDGVTDTYYFAHISANGTLLSREIGFYTAVVDPNDGSVWRLTVPANEEEANELTRLQPDGTELWHLTLPPGGSHHAEDATDQSVWVINTADTITHVAADSAIIRQWNAASMWSSYLWPSPDGSLWSSFRGLEDGSYWVDPMVVHFSASGAERIRLANALIVGVNDSDGSVWIRDSTGDYVQYSASDGEVRRFSPHLDIHAFSPGDNSFWGFGPLEAGSPENTTHYLLHVGSDGTVLNYSESPWLQYSLLGETLSPADGSLWVGESNPRVGWTVDATVQIASDGTVLERRIPGIGAGLQHDSAFISSFDGTWWIYHYGTASYLGHHNPDGTEISAIYNFSYNPVLNPTDGSLWGARTIYSGSAYTSTLQHRDANGALLWSKSYASSISDPVLQPDGSAWVVVDPTETSAAYRDYVAADGTSLGTLPLTAKMLSDPTANPPLYVHGWNQGTDGKIYVLFNVYGPEGHGNPSDGGIRCFSPEGVLLWEQAGLGPTGEIRINPIDHSVWVNSTDKIITPAIRGSAIIHLAADGTILWQGVGFNGPWRLMFDPRDYSVWVSDVYNYQIVHLRVITNPFTDVNADSWAYDEIVACKEVSIVTGYADGSYRPWLTVRRDHMATYLARALCGGEDFVPVGPTLASFADVPTDFWAYNHIEYCKAHGVAEGYLDGYHPERTVKRDQMAVFIGRADAPESERPDLPSYTPPVTPSFPDVPANQWAYKHIEYCKANGIAQGYVDGYHPERVVTRDQMAVYIARAFGL